MGPLHSTAKKNWWATKTPEERSAIMSMRVKTMWAKKTDAQKKKIGLTMTKARLKLT